MRKFRKSHFLLQLPLFYFGRTSQQRFTTIWKNNGIDYTLSCVSRDGLPGARELLIYNCLLHVDKSEFNNGDLLSVLGYTSNSRAFSSALCKSLQKLATAKYTFDNCLQTGEKIHSSLIQLRKHGKGRGTYYAFSLPDIIACHQTQRGKYQVLNLDAIIELGATLSMRLYEFLEKKKNQCRTFCISEKQICQWLPIHGKHMSDRLRTLQKAVQRLCDYGYLSTKTMIAEQCEFVFCRKKKITTPPQIKKGSKDTNIDIDVSWLLAIVEDFDPTCLREFTREHLDEYLPLLQKKIAQVDMSKIANKTGWILEAIRNKWEPIVEVKRQVQEKARQEVQQQFEQIQQQRLQREQQQQRKAIEQQQVKSRLVEIRSQINAEKLWQEALTKVQFAPQTARQRLAKFHFCDEVARMGDFSSELLDFTFCDYLFAELYDKNKNSQEIYS